MKSPSRKALKKLFGESDGFCSFDDCYEPITNESGSGAEICHIRANNPRGPRYCETQSPEERNSEPNLILLCPTHHAKVDSDPTTYTVEILQKMKSQNKDKTTRLNPQLSVEDISRMVKEIVHQTHRTSVSSDSQQGGITAHTVNFIQNSDSGKRPISFLVEYCCLPVGGAAHPSIRYLTFNLRVTNTSSSTFDDWEIAIDFPAQFLTHGAHSHLEVPTTSDSTRCFSLTPENRAPNTKWRPRHHYEFSEQFSIDKDLDNDIGLNADVFIRVSAGENFFGESPAIRLSDAVKVRNYTEIALKI